MLIRDAVQTDFSSSQVPLWTLLKLLFYIIKKGNRCAWIKERLKWTPESSPQATTALPPSVPRFGMERLIF